MSQGRFLFGIGGGWKLVMMENHGTVYASRFKRMRESIEAMKEIWAKPVLNTMGSSSILIHDRQAETGAETAPADPCRWAFRMARRDPRSTIDLTEARPAEVCQNSARWHERPHAILASIEISLVHWR